MWCGVAGLVATDVLDNRIAFETSGTTESVTSQKTWVLNDTAVETSYIVRSEPFYLIMQTDLVTKICN